MLRDIKNGDKIAEPIDSTNPVIPPIPSPEEIAKQIAAIQTMIDTFCVAPPTAIGDPTGAIGGPVPPTNSTDPVTPAKPMTMLEMIMNQWNTAKD